MPAGCCGVVESQRDAFQFYLLTVATAHQDMNSVGAESVPQGGSGRGEPSAAADGTDWLFDELSWQNA